MTKELIEAGALRQFKHNDGSEGFVFAYDKAIVDRVLASEFRKGANVGGGKIPRESNDKLLALARHWKLDGDWMTCKGCKRSLIASRDGEELNHADGCKFTAEQHPWSQLRELITPRPAEDVIKQAARALTLAMEICDAVPSRLHKSEGDQLANIGMLVNAQDDGTHGYALIRDAKEALEAELPSGFREGRNTANEDESFLDYAARLEARAVALAASHPQQGEKS